MPLMICFLNTNYCCSFISIIVVKMPSKAIVTDLRPDQLQVRTPRQPSWVWPTSPWGISLKARCWRTRSWHQSRWWTEVGCFSGSRADLTLTLNLGKPLKLSWKQLSGQKFDLIKKGPKTLPWTVTLFWSDCPPGWHIYEHHIPDRGQAARCRVVKWSEGC